ncbi:GNAT family protein [Saccharothrix longispora]|uniref:Aminoglycoside 6'-N-acetyltransferase n=1 Tax=Saccharothrix longispora TaxID=33920 RepID=A0ABU1PVG5_9PSEU|nr:GNAT family protein [Saccharothrix longispora]MDR6594635.1 aminoglycoside 6'-N-acetyltransferase [Saccharothrix longispora]
MLLTSRRLVLRHFRPGDEEAFAAYRSDPEVARYQAWDTPLSLREATAAVARHAAADPDRVGWFPYAIALDGHLIGDIGVNLHENRKQAEIGFSVATPFQGRGYATEAVERLLRHLFLDLDLHRVSAECDPRNTTSARLLERVGFRREGLRRENTWLRDEWVDDLLFGLLAPDYRRGRAAGGALSR